MFYFKFIDENEKTQIGTNSVTVPTGYLEITETEYNTLLAEFEAYQATIEDYVQKVASGEITIDEVPDVYREEVKAKLPNNDYGIDDTTYNNVIDDYTMELVEKGVL